MVFIVKNRNLAEGISINRRQSFLRKRSNSVRTDFELNDLVSESKVPNRVNDVTGNVNSWTSDYIECIDPKDNLQEDASKEGLKCMTGDAKEQ